MFLTETMLPHFKLSAFRFSLLLFLVTVLNTENKMKEGLRVANRITLLFVRTSVRLLTVYFFQKIKIYWTSVNNGTAKQTTQKVGSSLQIQNPLKSHGVCYQDFCQRWIVTRFLWHKKKEWLLHYYFLDNDLHSYKSAQWWKDQKNDCLNE